MNFRIRIKKLKLLTPADSGLSEEVLKHNMAARFPKSGTKWHENGTMWHENGTKVARKQEKTQPIQLRYCSTNWSVKALFSRSFLM
jgi:hypothetical protein